MWRHGPASTFHAALVFGASLLWACAPASALVARRSAASAVTFETPEAAEATPAPTGAPDAAPRRFVEPTSEQCVTACMKAEDMEAQGTLTLVQYDMCVACHAKELSADLNRSITKAAIQNENEVVAAWTQSLTLEATLLAHAIQKLGDATVLSEEQNWQALRAYKLELIDAVRHGVLLSGFDATRVNTAEEVSKRAQELFTALLNLRSGPLNSTNEAWLTAYNVSKTGADESLYKFHELYDNLWRSMEMVRVGMNAANQERNQTINTVLDADWNREVSIMAGDKAEHGRVDSSYANVAVESSVGEAQAAHTQVMGNTETLTALRAMVDNYVTAANE